jgi:hypothetical protein
MASDNVEDVIAERRLTLVSNAGEAREIVVRIGKPALSPDHDNFVCECQIVGVGKGSVRPIHGLDAFQSLQLTLRFISATLNYYRREAEGRIYWEEPGDDMGFAEVDPNPTSGR